MKTVQLTAKETAKDKIFYLTSLDKVEADLLLNAKKNNTLNDLSSILGINCVNVLKFGETAKSSPYNITEYVGFLYGHITDDKPKINANRPKFFRDYNQTEEKQADIIALVDIGMTSLNSAKSALKKMKEEYCCVWWDYKEVLW